MKRRQQDSSRTPELLISCVVLSVSALLAACAPSAPVLPSGAGTPLADFSSAYRQATAVCRDVKTLTVSMALSGKAGSTKLRGRIDAGFAAPAQARLEGIPPFGKPVFVLVADGTRGTLVLSREDRVLADASPEAIVEALAGVALGPDVLRTVIAGCGFSDAAPIVASSLRESGEWVRLTFPESAGYLRREAGAWRLVAATQGTVTVRYADFVNARPTTIAIQSAPAASVIADIRLRLSDVETNTTLDPRAFKVDLPDHPVPLTLDELRRAGPLGR